MSKWEFIWNNRCLPNGENILDRLIQADGFDNGAGKIDSNSWKEYVMLISRKLALKKKESIFEIGCGSGALLYPFYERKHKVGGIDFSGPLIEIAEDVMQDMNFQVCDAVDLDTKEKFDVVISNSVFHYFKDLYYAKSVIEKMLDKAKYIVAILEVPDLALKEESEKTRRESLPAGEYEKRYKELGHLYYNRNWFYRLGKKHGCSVNIFRQNIKNYGNNNFRFNVVLRKWQK